MEDATKTPQPFLIFSGTVRIPVVALLRNTVLDHCGITSIQYFEKSSVFPMAEGKEKKDKVLTYKNNTLYEADLQSLQPGMWLNDTMIGFYLEYLEDKVSSLPVKIVLIHPNVVYMAKFMRVKEFKEVTDPIGVNNADIIFIPLNDNDQAEKIGGSHWSLLIWVSQTNTFYHLDSIGVTNERVALKMAMKFFPLCKKTNPNAKENITVLDVPKQTNHFDCGIYVLAYTRHVIDNYNKSFHHIRFDVITPKYITNFRTEMKELIKTLAETKVENKVEVENNETKDS